MDEGMLQELEAQEAGRDGWWGAIEDPARESFWVGRWLLDERWQALFRFIIRNGELSLVELRVMSTPFGPDRAEHVERPDGISARLLREVPIQEAISFVLNHLQTVEGSPAGDPIRTTVPLRWRDVTVQPPARPGRKGKGDEFYLRWAIRYRTKIEEGSRYPVAALAEEHGLNPSQVRDLIHKARTRDLLSPAPPGRAGGRLTNRAQELLKELSDERGSH